jgi:hypothetical protein
MIHPGGLCRGSRDDPFIKHLVMSSPIQAEADRTLARASTFAKFFSNDGAKKKAAGTGFRLSDIPPLSFIVQCRAPTEVYDEHEIPPTSSIFRRYPPHWLQIGYKASNASPPSADAQKVPSPDRGVMGPAWAGLITPS